VDELGAGVAQMWLERKMALLGHLHWWQLLDWFEWPYQRSINTLSDVYQNGTVVWYE
jgi:hypothetical protein